MPTIGIVIPVYNGERYLGETVESVLAQGFADWELVLVDDGSTDGSGAVAAAFAARDPRIRLIRQPNGGVARARNAGLRALGGECEFVAFLDQDDIWHPDALDVLRNALAEDPLAAAAHGSCRLIDSSGSSFLPTRIDTLFCSQRWGVVGRRLLRWPPSQPTSFPVVAFLNPIATPGQVLIRCHSLAAVGDFDPAVSLVTDWDMWIRLTRDGHLAYVRRPVLAYRRHSGGGSASPEAMAEPVRLMRRKYADSQLLHPWQQHLLDAGELWSTFLWRWIWMREDWDRRQYRKAARELPRVARALARAYFHPPFDHSTA